MQNDMNWISQSKDGHWVAVGNNGRYYIRQESPTSFALVWFDDILLKRQRFESIESAKKFAEKHNRQQ